MHRDGIGRGLCTLRIQLDERMPQHPCYTGQYWFVPILPPTTCSLCWDHALTYQTRPFGVSRDLSTRLFAQGKIPRLPMFCGKKQVVMSWSPVFQPLPALATRATRPSHLPSRLELGRDESAAPPACFRTLLFWCLSPGLHLHDCCRLLPLDGCENTVWVAVS